MEILAVDMDVALVLADFHCENALLALGNRIGLPAELLDAEHVARGRER